MLPSLDIFLVGTSSLNQPHSIIDSSDILYTGTYYIFSVNALSKKILESIRYKH